MWQILFFVKSIYLKGIHSGDSAWLLDIFGVSQIITVGANGNSPCDKPLFDSAI